MVWDNQAVGRYPRLTDDSPESVRVRSVAKAAFENHYQGEKKWDDINPQVRDHWVSITAAVMAAIQEGI